MAKIICCIFTIDTKIGTNVSKDEILKVANLEGYMGSPKEVIQKNRRGLLLEHPPRQIGLNDCDLFLQITKKVIYYRLLNKCDFHL